MPRLGAQPPPGLTLTATGFHQMQKQQRHRSSAEAAAAQQQQEPKDGEQQQQQQGLGHGSSTHIRQVSPAAVVGQQRHPLAKLPGRPHKAPRNQLQQAVKGAHRRPLLKGIGEERVYNDDVIYNMQQQQHSSQHNSLHARLTAFVIIY